MTERIPYEGSAAQERELEPSASTAMTDVAKNFSDGTGEPLYNTAAFDEYAEPDYDDVSGYDELEQPDEQTQSFSELDAWFTQQTPEAQQQFVNSLSPDDVNAIQMAAAREQVDAQLAPMAEFHANFNARREQQAYEAQAAEEQAITEASREGERLAVEAIREHASRSTDPADVIAVANEFVTEALAQGYDASPELARSAIDAAAVQLGARQVVRGILGVKR